MWKKRDSLFSCLNQSLLHLGYCTYDCTIFFQILERWAVCNKTENPDPYSDSAYFSILQDRQFLISSFTQKDCMYYKE